ALNSLMSCNEAYPDLTAKEKFLNLQAQLEGTEKRITIARRNYTEKVAAYNTAIKKFPTNIYAGWFGFEPKPQFQAEAGAQSAPKVEF
ncbi:MAG: LemA family protein, partial [Muribaculaceae bacterium]|nr:LemA family protein [Muribaculaceae bacterium]